MLTSARDGSLCWYHAAHKLRSILKSNVDLVLADHLGNLCEILKMHLLYLTLNLVFFFIELLHVLFHKLFYIDVFVAGAERCLSSCRSGWARPPSWSAYTSTVRDLRWSSLNGWTRSTVAVLAWATGVLFLDSFHLVSLFLYQTSLFFFWKDLWLQ